MIAFPRLFFFRVQLRVPAASYVLYSFVRVPKRRLAALGHGASGFLPRGPGFGPSVTPGVRTVRLDSTPKRWFRSFLKTGNAINKSSNGVSERRLIEPCGGFGTRNKPH